MKKWVKLIWLIISAIVFILALLMTINTMVSYKYEISERMILGKIIQGFDSVPIEIAERYLNGELLVLMGFALYVGINIIFIVGIMIIKKRNKNQRIQ